MRCRHAVCRPRCQRTLIRRQILPGCLPGWHSTRFQLDSAGSSLRCKFPLWQWQELSYTFLIALRAAVAEKLRRFSVQLFQIQSNTRDLSFERIFHFNRNVQIRVTTYLQQTSTQRYTGINCGRNCAAFLSSQS